MSRTAILMLSLLFAALAAGCASMTEKSANSIDQITGDWRLLEIGGTPIKQLLPVVDREPTMVISHDGRIAGFAGVNRFSGQIDLDALGEGRFHAGPFISTKMAGPGESMAVEARFLDLLDQVDSVTTSGGLLRLHAGEETVLKFKRE